MKHVKAVVTFTVLLGVQSNLKALFYVLLEPLKRTERNSNPIIFLHRTCSKSQQWFVLFQGHGNFHLRHRFSFTQHLYEGRGKNLHCIAIIPHGKTKT